MEVVVALTLLAIGVLALAAAATSAQRAMTTAEIDERAVRAAAAVIDSLLREDAPADGEAVLPGLRLRWTVNNGSERIDILTTVEYLAPDAARRLEYHSSRAPGVSP